jgi:membrane protease YdiL (CAAX protease family)
MEGSAYPRHPGRLAGWLVFVLALTTLNYIGRFSGIETPDDAAYQYATTVAAVAQYALMLGIALLIARRLPRPATFGLARPESWRRALGLSTLAIVAIYAFSFAYTRILALFTDENPSCEQGLVPTEWDPDRAGAFAAFFVAVVFVGPTVEELIYRGLGFALLVPWGAATAILATGILFGATHGLVLGLPVLAVFGIVVGWLRLRTDSVYPPMLVHSTFNGIALIAALLVTSPC